MNFVNLFFQKILQMIKTFLTICETNILVELLLKYVAFSRIFKLNKNTSNKTISSFHKLNVFAWIFPKVDTIYTYLLRCFVVSDFCSHSNKQSTKHFVQLETRKSTHHWSGRNKLMRKRTNFKYEFILNGFGKEMKSRIMNYGKKNYNTVLCNETQYGVKRGKKLHPPKKKTMYSFTQSVSQHSSLNMMKNKVNCNLCVYNSFLYLLLLFL